MTPPWLTDYEIGSRTHWLSALAMAMFSNDSPRPGTSEMTSKVRSRQGARFAFRCPGAGAPYAPSSWRTMRAPAARAASFRLVTQRGVSQKPQSGLSQSFSGAT